MLHIPCFALIDFHLLTLKETPLLFLELAFLRSMLCGASFKNSHKKACSKQAHTSNMHIYTQYQGHPSANSPYKPRSQLAFPRWAAWTCPVGNTAYFHAKSSISAHAKHSTVTAIAHHLLSVCIKQSPCPPSTETTLIFLLIKHTYSCHLKQLAH